MVVQQLKVVSKFLHHVLGVRPWAFGLLPDADGYVRIRDLLNALHEERKWRHVRVGMLKEVCITLPNASIEMTETCIRATDRNRLASGKTAENVPKLLYTCVRARAHFHVVNKGHYPAGDRPVLLFADLDKAVRVGERKGQKPVLLTVQMAAAAEAGVAITAFGDGMFTAPFLPQGTFTAPPLPKARAHKQRPEKTKKTPPLASPPMAGGYLPDPDRLRHPPGRTGKKGKDKGGWKQERKRVRREKEMYGTG
ncbi:MAG: hypothetical protein CSA22_01725 [Deltaproteobacteria bacterium]|nr:MAG: hypothetical protein CSA22_01725 [Deltaproteobacteria bacterium]